MLHQVLKKWRRCAVVFPLASKNLRGCISPLHWRGLRMKTDNRKTASRLQLLPVYLRAAAVGRAARLALRAGARAVRARPPRALSSPAGRGAGAAGRQSATADGRKPGEASGRPAATPWNRSGPRGRRHSPAATALKHG